MNMNGKNRIEDICKKVPAFKELYNARVRHYIIKDHTLNVYNQFVRYFLENFPKTKIEEFTLFLLLHDIGKSISYNNGNRQNQYNDSFNELSKYKTELNISEDSMSLYKALLSSSSIGKYMENKVSLEDTCSLITAECKNAKLQLRDFFYLLSVYYQCDIASYTKDAGGLPYLEHLFEYQNGLKVYHEKTKLLKFSNIFHERYNQLYTKVVEYIESNTSIDLIPKSKSSQQVKVKILGKIDLSKFEKPKKEIRKNKQNLYIIDTNVFVDYPEIISKINKQYPVILSAKVIDELDNLKSTLDNNGKRQVQKALKSINQNIDKRDLRMVLADLSLLPIDFNKQSPDNLILTVALKFKSENPILLTSDNGLQVKAKGYNITTITLKEFLQQLR
jgi:rRNA-processing protein FCF1